MWETGVLRKFLKNILNVFSFLSLPERAEGRPRKVALTKKMKKDQTGDS